MPKMIMQSIVESLGYCCPLDYFRKHKKIPTRPTARRFGVDRYTIIYWKRKARDPKAKCPGYENCALIAERQVRRNA